MSIQRFILQTKYLSSNIYLTFKFSITRTKQMKNLGDLNGQIYPQYKQFAFQVLAFKIIHVNSIELKY